MMNKPILTFIFFISLSSCVFGQQITKVETGSSNILVVYLETGWINIKETNRPTTYEDFKPDNLNWSVNGQSPNHVGIYSNVVDEKKAIFITNEVYFPVKMRHRVYLILLSSLIENQSYLIESDYGDYELKTSLIKLG